jgi:uncharacterized protein YodC (DUF2158 family)
VWQNAESVRRAPVLMRIAKPQGEVSEDLPGFDEYTRAPPESCSNMRRRAREGRAGAESAASELGGAHLADGLGARSAAYPGAARPRYSESASQSPWLRPGCPRARSPWPILHGVGFSSSTSSSSRFRFGRQLSTIALILQRRGGPHICVADFSSRGMWRQSSFDVRGANSEPSVLAGASDEGRDAWAGKPGTPAGEAQPTS